MYKTDEIKMYKTEEIKKAPTQYDISTEMIKPSTEKYQTPAQETLPGYGRIKIIFLIHKKGDSQLVAKIFTRIAEKTLREQMKKTPEDTAMNFRPESGVKDVIFIMESIDYKTIKTRNTFLFY